MNPEPNLNTNPREIAPFVPQSAGNKELIEVKPNPEPTIDTTKVSKLTVDDLLSDISSSKQLNEIINSMDLESLPDENLPISPTISQTADMLKNINVIKDELCKLPLDTCELDYVTTNVLPLLTVIYELSTVSDNLATSVNFLSISSIVHPKRHELKDTTHLIYKINDECEDVYEVLKKRINLVLKNTPEK
jgi:hypothetical protein